MTDKQRKLLDWLASEDGPQAGDSRQAIAAALADVDACQAALGPIAAGLREQIRSRPDQQSRAIMFDAAEAAAVLAAAGSERIQEST